MKTYHTFREWLDLREAEQKPGLDQFDVEAGKEAHAMSRINKQRKQHKGVVYDAAKEAPKQSNKKN